LLWIYVSLHKTEIYDSVYEITLLNFNLHVHGGETVSRQHFYILMIFSYDLHRISQFYICQ